MCMCKRAHLQTSVHDCAPTRGSMRMRASVRVYDMMCTCV